MSGGDGFGRRQVRSCRRRSKAGVAARKMAKAETEVPAKRQGEMKLEMVYQLAFDPEAMLIICGSGMEKVVVTRQCRGSSR